MRQTFVTHVLLSHNQALQLFCMPPGTGDWLAYAYINSWDSYYNDYWCQRVSGT
jgi:hypothetical protein